MPTHCKMQFECESTARTSVEYIRLYKKKFNGPQSSFAWRRSLPALTAEDLCPTLSATVECVCTYTTQDATTLGLIELSYPADKLVNFRLMAQTEMKTETSINCYAEEGTMPARSPRSNLSWQVRELTPMEQLHLHGQHGFGTNIFRGLPPPPSNLKVRIDIVAPDGLWWVCSLSTATAPRRADSWAVAVDSRQPIRLLLVDSITDNSVFATMEVPRAKKDDRPVALLLGRTEEAFASSSPGRRADGPDAGQGGTGPAEWCSVLEFDGSLCCWGQVKTVPMCASHSPWDIFASFNCGTVIDHELRQNDTSFGRKAACDGISSPVACLTDCYVVTRVSPIEEVLSAGFSKGSNTTKPPTIREEAAFVRLNLPLRLASGQEGPLVEFLRWCMAPAPKMRWPHAGSQQSALAYLAVLVRSGYDLAALRAHISLPPLLLKGLSGVGPETEGLTPFCLPRLEAACHVEHGGLVDGFVVGMHNLYNFANMVATMPGMKRPQAANSLPAPMGRRHVSGNAQPLSLEPLEQAPPVMLALGALLTATALVLSGGRKRNETESSMTSAAPATQRSELLSLTQEHGLAGLFHQVGPGDPLAGITLISTLPGPECATATPASQVSTSHRSATSVDTRDTGVSAAITSSGPIGQALLEKVNSVSAKAEALLGTRRPPLSSRAPQSLGEKLVDLTERLGQLEKLLDDLRTRGAGVFSPPARVVPPARTSTLSAEAAAEASVKAVAKSLLDAARNRSPSGTKTQTSHMHVTPPSLVQAKPATGCAVVRHPSQPSRSTTPVTTSRIRTPGATVSSQTPSFASPPAGGLTPPPGLFLPITSLMTPGFSTPTAESLAINANRHLNGMKTPGGSTPRTNLSMFTGTPLGQSWEGRFSPAPPPLMPVSSRSPSLNRTPAAPAPFQYAGTVQLPPKLPVQEAEGKIRQWLDTIPIGNGAERGWDDAQIREIAEFAASQQNLQHLSAEQLYQRYVEHQVAQAEASH
eukprot:s2133_g10.t4